MNFLSNIKIDTYHIYTHAEVSAPNYAAVVFSVFYEVKNG